MRELGHLPQLESCSKVFLNSTEKPKGLYLCWQESTRLGYVKIDAAITSPGYHKFVAVTEIKALSKYLFAASNNSIFFWAPENSQATPSVFVELSKEARIITFTFINGRFLLLWTKNYQRKVYVTLTNKKAQILSQRELSKLAVFNLDFLEQTEPPFHIEATLSKVWVSLPDRSLWTASLDEDSIGEFVKVASLHSPVIGLTRKGDMLHCICCLGRFYSISDTLEIQTRRCVAPVIRTFPLRDSVLTVTPLECVSLKYDGANDLIVQRTQWRDLLAVVENHGDPEVILCVTSLGRIFCCSATEFLQSPTQNNDSDPWEKLQKLANVNESRALTHLTTMDSLQRQMALLMYLKFNALKVICDITQRLHPSLIEDQIISCEVNSDECFDSSMWIASLILKPHGKEVAMMKSTAFYNKGTTVSLQLECPSSLIFNVRVYLSLKTRLTPRALSLLIHEQDLCSLKADFGTTSSGFLVHRPSIECSIAEDLQSLIQSIIGTKDGYSISMINNSNLVRIILRKAGRKQVLSLRAVLMKLLLRKTISLEPNFLVPKTMEHFVKTSKEQLESCQSIVSTLAFYEQWRAFTMNLPLL